MLRGIAASRAGEAGKGFAVVASEVKQMAHDSGHVAETISDHLGRAQAMLDQVRGRTSVAGGRAIRALQFEDIVGQLVGTMIRRLDRLRLVTEALGAGLDPDGVGRGPAMLDGSARSTTPAPVQQSSMAAGTIELF